MLLHNAQAMLPLPAFPILLFIVRGVLEFAGVLLSRIARTASNALT